MPGKLQFAVSQVSFVSQKTFSDSVSSLSRSCLVSHLCTRLHYSNIKKYFTKTKIFGTLKAYVATLIKVMLLDYTVSGLVGSLQTWGNLKK